MDPVLLCVGVDIAAKTLTAVSTHTRAVYSRAKTFDQTPEGFRALLAWLAESGIPPPATLFVCEATGSYWITFAVSMHHAGATVSVINPYHAAEYANSLGRRSKTDPLDARMLAQLAWERRPAGWTPPPAIYHELRQRLMAREALLEMRQQARNQRHALLQWPVVVADVTLQFDHVIRTLSEQLAEVEAQLARVLAAGEWAASALLVQSIPGIGMLSSAWLLVTTLNFTLCANASAATAYAGLDPLRRESGTSIRGQPTLGRGGNRHLRTTLYQATLSAARYNPLIKAFYERLRAAGKPTTVARCAAARKLLHLCWAVVTKGQAFDPAYGQAGRPVQASAVANVRGGQG
jgi:transposase